MFFVILYSSTTNVLTIPCTRNGKYTYIHIRSLLEPRDDTPAKEIEIEKMSVTLETMRKDNKNDNDIINELMKMPEDVVDFDRAWNATYSLVWCGQCIGPMLEH